MIPETYRDEEKHDCRVYIHTKVVKHLRKERVMSWIWCSAIRELHVRTIVTTLNPPILSHKKLKSLMTLISHVKPQSRQKQGIRVCVCVCVCVCVSVCAYMCVFKTLHQPHLCPPIIHHTSNRPRQRDHHLCERGVPWASFITWTRTSRVCF